MKRLWTALVVAGWGLLLMPGCGLVSDDEVELTGESAFDYIRKDRSTAPSTDVDSVKEIMEWAEEDYQAKKKSGLRSSKLRNGDASRVEPSEAVLALLKKTTKAKKNLQPDLFDRVDFASLADEDDSERKVRKGDDDVDLSSLQDEFYIDNMNAIPVRNQGYRGTCAAFTGTGSLEYATVKKYNTLPTMDLSEQRFYYLSKPECQSNGCGLDEQGSWYGDGFDASVASSEPIIPLEADCPYSMEPGDNDVQVPQLDSCETGALKVVSLQAAKTPQEIVDALHDTGLPVPFASPLSGNWEVNRGLITYADSGHTGDTSHAGGHAYLVVGYRKLADMPEEGGMCFVIKNSWGTGWGVNGYSCMTLKWVQNWTFGRYLTQPIVVDVLLRDDLQTAEELPNNEEAEDAVPPDVPDESEGMEDSTQDDSEAREDEVEEELDNLPEADDEGLSFSSAKLFGPGESYYQAEFAQDGDKVYLRAKVRENSSYTNPLELDTDSQGRFLVGEDAVGEKQGDDLYLCSGEYDLICSLRLDTTENKLYVEFPYPDMRKVTDDELPEGSWQGFEIPFGDYEFQVYAPDSLTDLFSTKQYFRMKKENGDVTEPARVSLSGTDIKVMAEPIGSIDPSNLGLCTGEFADKCAIFAPGDELNILPSW